MPQASRTVNDIIVNSFYQIGELSPDEVPSASLISRGLYLLNDMLDSFAVSGIYIPFIRDLTFNLSAGKDIYTISNVVTADITYERLVALEYVNVKRDTVSYPVRVINRAELFNQTRVTDLPSRPTKVILERRDFFSQLQFYPVPQFDYECTIRGKFMFDKLELYDAIDEVPAYYYRFMRYALARELKSFYPSANWGETDEKEFQKMMKDITGSNDTNMLIMADDILMNGYRRSVYDSFGFS